MNIIYTLMDIGIIAAVFVVVRILKGNSARKRKRNIERTAKEFSNEELYNYDTEQHGIGTYSPAMNDISHNSSGVDTSYRYRVNPHTDYITSAHTEGMRNVHRTESMMMHQTIMNNQHLNM